MIKPLRYCNTGVYLATLISYNLRFCPRFTNQIGRVYDSELLAKLSFMNSLLSSELKTYIQITNKGDELVT